MDGPSGTPCTREEPTDIPHYKTDAKAGRPYQTTGDSTKTSPEATSDNSWPASQTLVQIKKAEEKDDKEAEEDDEVPSNQAEKVSILQTVTGRMHSTYS